MDDTAERRTMRGLARIYRIVNNRIVEEEYHPAITTSGFSLSPSQKRPCRDLWAQHALWLLGVLCGEKKAANYWVHTNVAECNVIL